MKTVLIDLTPYQTTHRVRGIGRYVHDLATGIAGLPASSSVRCLGLSWLDETGEATVIDDLSQLRPRGTSEGLPFADARVRYGRRMYLGRIARRVGADLVHLTDARGTPLFGPPRLVTCHDLIPLLFPERYLGWQDGYSVLRKAREVYRYRDAFHVLAISQQTRSDLLEILRVPSEKISVVYNGIDLSAFSPESLATDEEVRRRFGLRSPYLISVGAWEWRKNAPGMFAALYQARQAGCDLDLAFVGKISERELGALRALAHEHGVQAAVRPLGFVGDNDLSALYRQALGHCLVSFAEGFGLTLVEAMACGSPVIASAGSSLAEVVSSAGLLVDPHSADAIAGAMIRLFRDPSLQLELRRNGLVRAQRFSREHFAQETVKLYEQLLA